MYERAPGVATYYWWFSQVPAGDQHLVPVDESGVSRVLLLISGDFQSELQTWFPYQRKLRTPPDLLSGVFSAGLARTLETSGFLRVRGPVKLAAKQAAENPEGGVNVGLGNATAAIPSHARSAMRNLGSRVYKIRQTCS